ncbi:PGF-CTERM sorting domain-containing protein [Haloterrigena sp. H1]|uniref:PGF-CTERM sorting domain-containing protein n=1 Tax=Haloterrigena sp. H1 TaxID=2552943 RepID=UPI00110F03F3|nr:PGF-CTERM sorting domain-containing protein [Haloterrigena sp. H1]TMT87118.1 PGF-CTERM sorting domain-containing protein [Haloterrigena sp. H1]
MTRLSSPTALFVAALVVLSMAGAGAGTAVAAETTETSAEPGSTAEAVQTLENDDELYFVFGADLGNRSLDEFLESQVATPTDPSVEANQESIADIVQYQNVEKVNLNQQGGAVSIAIDGGEATAIQEETQQNTNSQVGEATAESTIAPSQDLSFENVGDVHIVFGNSDDRGFDGWSVRDETNSSGRDSGLPTEASTTQQQNVSQVNFNDQSIAVALAENESTALAYQRSTQTNKNRQQGSTTLRETGAAAGAAGQSAQATIDQSQTLSQINQNQQGTAVAIAVGNNSVATAVQLTDQTNLNEQYASVETLSHLESMAGMNIATADGTDKSMLTTGSEIFHDDEDESEAADVSVTQYQHSEQVNINLQSAAVAIALDGSNATAIQLAEQRNYNEQIGVTTAASIYENVTANAGTVITNETTLTIGGDAIRGTAPITLGSDGKNAENDQRTSDEQYSSARFEQIQFITQENRNQQRAAIAVAERNASANASHITVQRNRNVRFADVEATVDTSGDTAESDDGTGSETVENGSGGDTANGTTKKKAGKKSDTTGDETNGNVTDDEAMRTDTDAGDETADEVATDEPTTAPSDETDNSIPGFGVAVTLIALLAAALLAIRKER